MSYHKSSYASGEEFVDYVGDKYTVITSGNTPSIPLNKDNVVSGNIVWGSLELQPKSESSGGGLSDWASGTTYNVGDVETHKQCYLQR